MFALSHVETGALFQAFALGYRAIERPAKAAWRSVRVAKIFDETPSIRSIYFEPIDGQPLPRYRPGQYIRVRTQQCGQPVRCYTLSDLPRPRQWRITVKRQSQDGGSVSNHLHTLEVGSHVELSEPSGSFHVDILTNSEQLFLYAAGVGITPIYAIAAALTASRPAKLQHVTLAYQAASWAEVALKTELRTLAAAWPQLKIQLAISRPPHESDRSTWLELQSFQCSGHVEIYAGRRSCERLAAQTMPSAGCRVMACGPEVWMQQLRNCLRIRGHGDNAILMESFSGVLADQTPSDADVPVAEAGDGFAVRVGDDRKYYFREGGGTLLDQMLRQGVGMSSGCRRGECEACICRLRSGQVQYLASTPVQLQAGWILPCIAAATSDLELDLA